MSDKLKVMISFHLKNELVNKIKKLNPRIELLYEPTLLGEPRYMNDQHGAPIERTSEQEEKLKSMMAETEVLFGYVPRGYGSEIKRWLPKLKWSQSPSAGIGWGAKRFGWTETDITFTTASGVHSTPLAEFCLMSMLIFTKNYFHLSNEKVKKNWKRNSTTELRTKTLAVVGLGNVGKEVARLGRSLGMRVIGTKRTTIGVDPESVNVEKLYPFNDMSPMLSEADYVVLICPHTSETQGLLGEKEIADMKKGAVLINIARGTIVDEPALIEALISGHLGGFASDVFWKEPLPTESPFWDMPNVIISPHSASAADTENDKLTELFLDNLSRYIDGLPLINILNKKTLY